MKRYIVLAMIACLAFGLLGEEQERYILYPTKNMWTFLKLNTMTGQIRHVQYGMESRERFEYELNTIDLTALRGKKYINGRYKLYPTQNHWTFLLLDTLDGDTFQVQWGEEACGVIPILLGSIKRTEEDGKETKNNEDAASRGDTDEKRSGVGILDFFE